MKRMLPLAAITFLMLGALLAPANPVIRPPGADTSKNKADDDPLANPYIPLKVGTVWEYLSGGKTITVKVAGHDVVEGQTCARLEADSGKGVETEHITVKPDGIYRVRSNNKEIKPPLLLLKLPSKKSDSWTIDSSVQNFSLKGKLTVGEEKLAVGKTEYDAVSIKSSDLLLGGQNVAMQTWYAKDVGMVKQHLKMPALDYDVVLELSKFTAAK